MLNIAAHRNRSTPQRSSSSSLRRSSSSSSSCWSDRSIVSSANGFLALEATESLIRSRYQQAILFEKNLLQSFDRDHQQKVRRWMHLIKYYRRLQEFLWSDAPSLNNQNLDVLLDENQLINQHEDHQPSNDISFSSSSPTIDTGPPILGVMSDNSCCDSLSLDSYPPLPPFLDPSTRIRCSLCKTINLSASTPLKTILMQTLRNMSRLANSIAHSSSNVSDYVRCRSLLFALSTRLNCASLAHCTLAHRLPEYTESISPDSDDRHGRISYASESDYGEEGAAEGEREKSSSWMHALLNTNTAAELWQQTGATAISLLQSILPKENGHAKLIDRHSLLSIARLSFERCLVYQPTNEFSRNGLLEVLHAIGDHGALMALIHQTLAIDRHHRKANEAAKYYRTFDENAVRSIIQPRLSSFNDFSDLDSTIIHTPPRLQTIQCYWHPSCVIDIRNIAILFISLHRVIIDALLQKKAPPTHFHPHSSLKSTPPSPPIRLSLNRPTVNARIDQRSTNSSRAPHHAPLAQSLFSAAWAEEGAKENKMEYEDADEKKDEQCSCGLECDCTIRFPLSDLSLSSPLSIVIQQPQDDRQSDPISPLNSENDEYSRLLSFLASDSKSGIIGLITSFLDHIRPEFFSDRLDKQTRLFLSHIMLIEFRHTNCHRSDHQHTLDHHSSFPLSTLEDAAENILFRSELCLSVYQQLSMQRNSMNDSSIPPPGKNSCRALAFSMIDLLHYRYYRLLVMNASSSDRCRRIAERCAALKKRVDQLKASPQNTATIKKPTKRATNCEGRPVRRISTVRFGEPMTDAEINKLIKRGRFSS